MLTYDTLYIGGEWVAPAEKQVFDVVSPASEEVVGRVPEASKADVDAAVAAARKAFDEGPWSRTTGDERADAMARLSAIINERTEDFARTISTEMGSPLGFSRMGQVLAATMALDFFTGLARETAWEETRAGLLGPTVVRRAPVGVVAAIVPWNVPIYVSMLKLAPALAAGCTVVLKPAPASPISAQLLGEAIEAAGIPAGVVNIVPADRAVGEYLVTHPGIDKVSFTGSTAAGRRIASLCGENLRRVTLELGGKSAAVLLPDVDLATALPQVINVGLMNNGQACVAQTRILAPRDRYREVVDAVVEQVAAQIVGDPLDEATTIGPLVSSTQRERVEGFLAAGKKEGATVALGGGRPKGFDRGWYVEPTVFSDVDNKMTIAQEEIFGPVLSVIPYGDVDDAVAIANDSRYGLSGSVWTADADAGLGIARRIRTGTFNVNTFMLENCAPFGGFKESGLGRELGPEGLAAYVEYQSVNLPYGYTPAS
ncbi:aldehyde dehydrogenase [Cryptosporangium aurantiacum]|uniref:aldehyde dehydrogenase (NAD(+)) n=1 Tax=Cryptosporangium aurantiacum TaxID=134849 RepID=A0A1M7RKC7_9ACTN|nr:aldehyde dehydrogenase [Cryptosporangium aurantiacum]SHN46600.1 betaine-aldehyde dehydrogenase [Cryptosporangium aurantiacum]